MNGLQLFDMTKLTDQDKTAPTRISDTLSSTLAVEHLTEFNGVPDLPSIIFNTIFLTKYRDNGGGSILMYTVDREDLAMTKLVVHLDKTLINTPASSGLTPLMLAAKKGNLAIVSLLLDPSKLDVEVKAEVNAALKDGQTALHKALHGGNRNVAELLVQKGADKELEDEHGLTPADYAFFKGHSYDLNTGEGLGRSQEVIAQWEKLAADFVPIRGVVTLEELISKLGLVRV